MTTPYRQDLADFYAHLIGLGRSPRTAETYVKSLRRLERATGKLAHDITRADLIAYRATGACVATIQVTFSAMRSYHLYGVEHSLWAMDGILAVAVPRRQRLPAEWLPRIATATLLEIAQSSQAQRLIYLGLYAGCRISESTDMTPRQDLGDRLRFVGKGHKLREVPIHPELRAKLPRIFAEPTRAANLHYLARRIVERTGIYFRPHALRATFAHMLEEADVDHDVRAALLGHGNTQTMHYSGVSWRRRVAAIEMLNYWETP